MLQSQEIQRSQKERYLRNFNKIAEIFILFLSYSLFRELYSDGSESGILATSCTQVNMAAFNQSNKNIIHNSTFWFSSMLYAFQRVVLKGGMILDCLRLYNNMNSKKI